MLPDASVLSAPHHRRPNNWHHAVTGSFPAADSCGGVRAPGFVGNNYNMEGHWREHSSSSSSFASVYTSPPSDHVGVKYRRTNNWRGGMRGEEDGVIRSVDFLRQSNVLKHPNMPRTSRAHPGLRIEIPVMGDGRGGGGGGGSSIISSTLPSSSSIYPSSISLNKASESTLTITEYRTNNSIPEKIESCAMLSLNKVLLKQRKSFSDTFSGIKSGFKARFLGAKSSSHGEEGLQKVCYSLINLPDEEMSSGQAARSENLNLTVFKRQSLTILVKALRNKEFELTLPSIPETLTSKGLEHVLAVDAEEHGSGGSFEKFVSMLPESCRHVSEKASPLGLVPKLLPYGEISANARYLASCFWMWLCIVDDLTETLTGEAWRKAESDLLKIFTEDTEETPPSPFPATSDIVKVSMALRTVVDETPLNELPVNGSNSSHHMNDDHLWRPIFREAVREVILGFRAERPLLGANSATKIDLAEWMRVRIITISVRPFMVIARASLGLDPTLSPLGNPFAENYQDLLRSSKKSNRNNLAKVECLLQLIMGLQNDIIGWDKDYKTKTPLNTIQILIKDGKKPVKALEQVIKMHNELVEHLAKYGDWVWNETFDLPPMTPSPYATQFMNHQHGDFNGSGGLVLTAQIPPLPNGGGGGLRVLGSHFSTTANNSSSNWSATSSLRTSGGGDGAGDNRDSLLSTRRPGTACTASNENLRKYLELVVGFSAGMANWMVDSRRYVV